MNQQQKCLITIMVLTLVLHLPESTFAQFTLTDVGHTTNSSSQTLAYAMDVVVSGKYAYLANNRDGLRIYDISDPTNPINVGYINDTGSYGAANALAVSGNYAYLADGQDGLRIYDVSNPARPINIAHKSDGGSAGYATDVAVSEHYLYLANGSDGLRIYNVSTPANPINAGYVPSDGDFSGPIGICVSGAQIYMACDEFGGLQVYDISSPASPVYSGGIITSNVASDVAVLDHYAYVANSGDGLRIYDLSNTAIPVCIGHTNNFGSYPNARRVIVSGNYAYLANDDDGIRVYDVSNPSYPVNVGHTATNYGGRAASLALSGNYLYLANENDGLRIYSLGPAVSPRFNIKLASTNVLLFSWPAPTRAFSLQQNSDLGSTNWSTMSNVVVTVDSRNQILTPLPPATRFYRLVSE